MKHGPAGHITICIHVDSVGVDRAVEQHTVHDISSLDAADSLPMVPTQTGPMPMVSMTYDVRRITNELRSCPGLDP